MLISLKSQYEKQIIEAIGNFKLKYDDILHKGEIYKKALILDVANIIKQNFEELGLFEFIKSDISSILISIFTNQNVVSISPQYINEVLTPLGYTNIRGKYKNKDQILDENRAIKELNSSVIFTHNVVKDLSVYNESIKGNLLQLEKEEYKHFNDDEILKVKDSIMKVYEKVNESINYRNSNTTIQEQLEKVQQNQQQSTNEDNHDSDTKPEVKTTQKEQEEDIKQKKKEEKEGKIILNKIDKPNLQPSFDYILPDKILELLEQHKLMCKNLKKYHQVLLMYPEYDKQYHDEFVTSIEERTIWMQGENEFIKPSTNLKFRRDPIGWVEIMECSEDMTEGAARSRSMVPATYLDKHGNIVHTFRKMSKEHITENLPYARKMKQLMKRSISYWNKMHIYYVRNVQPWTNGFSVKNHDKSSNSA